MKSDEQMIEEMDSIMAEESFDEHFKAARTRTPSNRTVTFGIRFSPEEAEQFSNAARARGLTFAEYIRKVLHAAQAGDLDLENAEALALIREKARELSEALQDLPRRPRLRR